MNALVDKIYRTMRKLGIFDLIPDEPYLKLMYRLKMGKPLDLKNPKTFNEKLQWLKLHDRNPEYIKMVDKYSAKEYVKGIIGEEHIIPTLGVYDSFDGIDFSNLPSKFVLKCTHDSGGIVICKDKELLNLADAREILKKCLRQNYYNYSREWPYKNVSRRIIAESFISESDGSIPKDYKVFCFNGKPQLIQVDLNRFDNHRKKLFSPEWQEFNFDFNYPTDRSIVLEKPAMLDEMLRLAEKLSDGFPFLRTDFYIIDNKIYFGELTFFPASGFGRFSPMEWDYRFGDLLHLDELRSYIKATV